MTSTLKSSSVSQKSLPIFFFPKFYFWKFFFVLFFASRQDEFESLFETTQLFRHHWCLNLLYLKILERIVSFFIFFSPKKESKWLFFMLNLKHPLSFWLKMKLHDLLDPERKNQRLPIRGIREIPELHFGKKSIPGFFFP